MKQSNCRKHILAAVILALLFNAVGALFAASSILNRAQSFANQDIALICTGNTYQWISMTTFHQTGEIEFVAAPENAPSNLQEIKCAYTYLADPQTDGSYLVGLTHSELDMGANSTIHYFGALFATAKHQLAHTRAPPVFS